MKKTQTTLFLAFSILLAISTVCLFVFSMKVIRNKNQHISAVSANLEQKIREKNEAIIFSEKISEIKSLQETINGYFLDTDKIDTFVSYLEGIGQNIGSEVSVKNMQQPPKTKNIISFEVEIVGTFNEVMRTINYIENIPYQINITKTYLNEDIKNISSNETEKVGENKTADPSTWQASLSFDVITLN